MLTIKNRLHVLIKSLPNGKILDWSKLKAFADDKINVAEKMISLCDRVENIAQKGENAGYHHFLLFPQCFQKLSFSGLSEVGIVWQRIKVGQVLAYLICYPFPKQEILDSSKLKEFADDNFKFYENSRKF